MFVQLVMAAMTMSPWSSVTSAPPREHCGGRAAAGARASTRSVDDGVGSGPRLGPAGFELPAFDAGGSLAGKDCAEASSGPRGENVTLVVDGVSANATRNDRLASVSGTRSCGRAGPAMLGTTAARSSSMVLGEERVGRARFVEEPLLLGVGLDQRDLLGWAAGESGDSGGSPRRSGTWRRWSRTRATCCRWLPGSRAAPRRRRGRRTRRTCRPRRGGAAAPRW